MSTGGNSVSTVAKIVIVATLSRQGVDNSSTESTTHQISTETMLYTLQQDTFLLRSRFSCKKKKLAPSTKFQTTEIFHTKMLLKCHFRCLSSTFGCTFVIWYETNGLCQLAIKGTNGSIVTGEIWEMNNKSCDD